MADDGWFTVELNADAEQAHVAGCGGNRFGYLFLHHNHHCLRLDRSLKKVAQDGRSDVIRQISHHLVAGVYLRWDFYLLCL